MGLLLCLSQELMGGAAGRSYEKWGQLFLVYNLTSYHWAISAVLSRQGAGPTLLSATVGKGVGQLSYQLQVIRDKEGHFPPPIPPHDM